MVGITADIDQAAIARLDAHLTRIQTQLPRRTASETRRAAIYICQSLRAKTPKAPKKVRTGEYAAIPSPVPPRYIHSNSRGRHLLRRWQLTRKLGTPQEYTKQYYVYTDARKGKGGKMVGKSPAAERRELLRLHGGITRAGLAKKSWGWVMKELHDGTAGMDLAWRRTRGERRDPRQYVKGKFAKLPDGPIAAIHNGLDYIGTVVPPTAVSAAVTAATKRLEHNVEGELIRAQNAVSTAPRRAVRSSYQTWLAHTKGWL